MDRYEIIPWQRKESGEVRYNAVTMPADGRKRLAGAGATPGEAAADAWEDYKALHHRNWEDRPGFSIEGIKDFIPEQPYAKLRIRVG